ncbi:hypothetical protein N7517_008781 [Penicillium concentricum]|uniref:Uncharacterized protein n=1 Tax=Penicillium concentricum TaxID=293559 RepID=A0A9W9RUJ5_9EURO|nr:uncharacterized protein N7517_008781 [Penicillium concentricum]KAJ5365895.1 hypothetical protein N7517_008781 [Penicillium concentricum]
MYPSHLYDPWKGTIISTSAWAFARQYSVDYALHNGHSARKLQATRPLDSPVSQRLMARASGDLDFRNNPSGYRKQWPTR